MIEADLILCNANVLTFDPDVPRAELIVIQNGRVLHVSNSNEFTAFKGPKTTIIDCNRRTILPGFHDAHCHPIGFAESLVSIDLSNANIGSITDIQNKIKEAAKNCQPGTWIRARGYNEFYLSEKRHPDRRDLDQATTDHAVILTHQSGHAHVLNSRALVLAGITVNTSEPPGGMIERDLDTGEPNGILYGMNEFLAQVIPTLDEKELEHGIKLANNEMLSLGITSVQDASVRNDIQQWQTYKRLKAEGIFVPRVNMMVGSEALNQFQNKELLSEASDDNIRPKAIKIMIDETRGHLNPCQDELNNKVLNIHRSGYQVAIHALEESTIEAACTALKYALHRYPRSGHRHRIEHCSVCTPSTVEHLAALDPVIVTQPAFLFYNGERYLKTIPGEQLNHLYPVSRLINAGLKVAASSDCPVVPPNPLHGIYAARTRTTKNGQKISTEEGLSTLKAIGLYTIDAAYSCFEEDIKGSITPGKLADLVILNEDPLEIPPEDIINLEVQMTIIDGKIVWRKKL